MTPPHGWPQKRPSFRCSWARPGLCMCFPSWQMWLMLSCWRCLAGEERSSKPGTHTHTHTHTHTWGVSGGEGGLRQSECSSLWFYWNQSRIKSSREWRRESEAIGAASLALPLSLAFLFFLCLDATDTTSPLPNPLVPPLPSPSVLISLLFLLQWQISSRHIKG